MGRVMAMQSKEIKERNEKVKQWLWQYRDAKKEVRRLEEELQELIELQESCRAIQYSDMPKGGGSQRDLSDEMVKHEKIWRKICKARYKQIIVFEKVKSAIDRLPTADQRTVMSYRYLRLMDWEKICIKTGYSWKHVHRFHAKALEEIKIRNDT